LERNQMTEPARPTQIIPRPATDATVSGGLPDAGLSTRLDPSTAITQGAQGGRKFSARVMNWILGGFGDWLAYMDAARADLLSRTAVLELCKINTRISANTSDLQALTGAVSGNEVYVSGVGLFHYTTAFTLSNIPWVYAATGMGTGSWVLDEANSLLSLVSTKTINPALINQNLRAFGTATPSAITYTNTSSTPTVVCSTTADVTGLAGSSIRIALSGLLATSVGISEIDVLLTFNDGGTTTHTAGQIILPAGSTVCLSLGYDFPVPTGATSCTVSLRGFTSGTSLSVTGSSATQWLQWSVLQIAS
jgi:hypothetical protein